MAYAAARQTDGQVLATNRIEPGFAGSQSDEDVFGGLSPENTNRTDAIVRAATDAFVAPRRRSPQEITIYAQLIRPLLPKVERDTLRWVSAVLAGCEFAPSETCRTLANQSMPIAAPILATATKLSVNDQISIAAHKSEEHRVLLAQRRNLSALVIEEIIDKAEAEPVRHLLRNKPKAMSEVQARAALAIIASAMTEETEAKAAASKLASTVITNDAQSVPTSTIANRADEMARMRSDLQGRTKALEKARNDLLALAQRANGHDVPKPAPTAATIPPMSATAPALRAQQIVDAQPVEPTRKAKVATDMLEVPSPQMTTPVPKAARTTMAQRKTKKDPLADAAATFDRNTLQRALETTLSLSPVKVSKLMAEPELEALCVALRAVECKPHLAHKLLTAVHMNARRDMRIIERLRIAYTNLNPADCRKALDEWQRDFPLGKPTMKQSPATQTAGLRGRIDDAPQTDDDLFEPEKPVTSFA